jgi:hypothetical protein
MHFTSLTTEIDWVAQIYGFVCLTSPNVEQATLPVQWASLIAPPDTHAVVYRSN